MQLEVSCRVNFGKIPLVLSVNLFPSVIFLSESGPVQLLSTFNLSTISNRNINVELNLSVATMR